MSLNFFLVSFLSTLIALPALGAGENDASGVYALLPGDRNDRPLAAIETRPIWNNANVDGVRARTFWDRIEPQRGRYYWDFIDAALAAGARSGKGVSLSIAAGGGTPEWVFAESGAARFSFTAKTNFADPTERRMALPWDPVFLKEWERFVRLVGKRYDQNPALRYFVIAGLGAAVETYLVKTPEDTARIESAGGLAAWKIASGKIIDFTLEAFPTTPCILALAPPVRGPEGMKALESVVQAALAKHPGRFGLMHCGLNAQSAATFPPNAWIADSAKSGPCGFQMVWAATGENSSRLKGTLAESLERGVGLGGHFIEVYESDCADPANATLLKSVAARLKRQIGR